MGLCLIPSTSNSRCNTIAKSLKSTPRGGYIRILSTTSYLVFIQSFPGVITPFLGTSSLLTKNPLEAFAPVSKYSNVMYVFNVAPVVSYEYVLIDLSAKS
jgi:hypothetical protein